MRTTRRNSIAANDFDANKSDRGNRVLVLTDLAASGKHAVRKEKLIDS